MTALSTLLACRLNGSMVRGWPTEECESGRQSDLSERPPSPAPIYGALPRAQVDLHQRVAMRTMREWGNVPGTIRNIRPALPPTARGVPRRSIQTICKRRSRRPKRATPDDDHSPPEDDLMRQQRIRRTGTGCMRTAGRIRSTFYARPPIQIVS